MLVVRLCARQAPRLRRQAPAALARAGLPWASGTWPTTGSIRYCSNAPAAASSPKLEALVDEISSLTLLEAAELTDLLKEKLGISSAMMMPMGGAAPAAAAAPAEEEAPAAEAKTIFTVRLEKFDPATKIKLIKEVRAITQLGLKESKELVEKAPNDVKVDVKQEEADEIKAKLEAVGGTVAID
jgi:large subunit ribosomal protein L7/L12